MSEPEAAGGPMKATVMHGVRIREIYGDGAFDGNDLFYITQFHWYRASHNTEEKQ